jgi:glycosyltransferase involved in cell wall biosynthesis
LDDALMTQRPTISLVLPACDEAENIAAALRQARLELARMTKEFEIIVVDDGSSDATAALAARHPGVRILRHESNRGYGAALRTGLRAARLDWVCFTDADLQFDLADLQDLIEASADYDLVAGYRAPRRDPLRRVLLGRLWGLAVRLLLGLRVRDVDCAFKLFRREVIDAIAIESVGAFVNTEILLRARSAGFRLREVPVRHFPRGAGRASGARPRVILVALRELLRLRHELR